MGKTSDKAMYVKFLNCAKLYMNTHTLDGLVVLFLLLGLDWSLDWLEGSMCGGSDCAGSWN